jgi:lycopene beta-cyclase
MYAMPMGPSKDGQKQKVFFEETSLVARPPISFDECKRRMELRLKHLGATVLSVEEEEFCYIPMGGAIPTRSQRVVAFGGALGLVHASTGYQICRALAAAGPAAMTIAKEVRCEGREGEREEGRATLLLWVCLSTQFLEADGRSVRACSFSIFLPFFPYSSFFILFSS